MNKKGFTLIELLLYVSMASIILSIVSGFLFISLKSRVKNQTIAEVDSQGIQVLEIMTQKIRNANSIDSPSIGNSASSLSLDGASTIFDLSANKIRINQGAAVELTSDKVIVSDLLFQNLSQVGTTGSIRVQFTISYDNNNNRNEYDYQKTFYASATLLAN